jgi:two-component system phosphate regulon response regulator OmpR
MRPKVLIVDDDPLMHLLYLPHLHRAGYQPLMAKDGSEVMEIAERESPALIIMDVLMIAVDGLSAVRELKRTDCTKEIPVIVVTANVGLHAMIKQEALASGAAVFLPKPFSPAQLVQEVKKLVPV